MAGESGASGGRQKKTNAGEGSPLGGLLVSLLGVAMALAGAGLAAGGGELIAAGGSPYYLLAGAALAAAGLGLVLRRGWALPLYGLLLAGTLVWALWEAGLDGWALVPRLVAPAVLGLILLIPNVRARAGGPSPSWLALPVLAVVVALGGAALKPKPAGEHLQAAAVLRSPDPAGGDWRVWGRTLAGDRYSPLAQINTGNVAKLKLAWRYDSNVRPYGFHSFEATPLAADGRLYICLDRNVVVALDPDTGHEVWRFDPHANLTGVFAATCRGVAYYEAPQTVADCPKRILFGVNDDRLMAVDAETGRPCQSFGAGGAVDLKQGLGPAPAGVTFPSSAPTIVRGVAILSGWVTDGLYVGEPSGVVRGYDAVTGALRWAWDSGRPDPQRPLGPGETYTKGAPNAWGEFSGDEALGLVYVPTGVSTPDYFGAHRSPDAERYATSIVALDAAAGAVRWSFQTVHHDLWDYDIGSQPVVVDLAIGGARVPALVAPTKRGQFFVLHRRTGQPLWPVTERPVPQGPAPGDWTAKTQPYSSFPNVAGGRLTEARMWGATPFDQLWCRIAFRRARYDGDFTPPGLRTAITFPGSAGGSNWGSVTIDTARGLMVANSLYMPDIGRLIPRAEADRLASYAKANGKADAFAFPQVGTPYAMQRTIFQNPIGVPCLQPPYGRISVFDLKRGRLVWSKALGAAYHAGPFGLSSYLPIRMGAPTLGGSIATGGGLIFIGASQDRGFRAFDIGDGRELWRASLPSVAAATPMTFVSRRTGRQYVVIAAGGHPGLGGPKTSAVMAYALPGDAK
jgi:membrane-bound PQQ-dependent dehydrogenase (glucose/quinate/shikimate family)